MQWSSLNWTPPAKSASNGWLTRHLQTAGNLPPKAIMPALAVGSQQPTSLLGSRENIGTPSPGDFSLNAKWYYGDNQRRASARDTTRPAVAARRRH